MVASIQIEVDNRSIYEKLDEMDTGFSAAAWAGFLVGVVGPYLQQRAKMRFKGQGDDVVGQWHPLKESTKSIRTQQGFLEGPINNRSGEMEQYITGGIGAAIPVGPVALFTFPNPASPLDQRMKDKLRTAAIGSKSPQTVPRPVLGMNATDAIHVVAAMAFYAQAVIDK